MCVGVPMRVLETQAASLVATCATRDGSVRSIDLVLVGPQPVGAWLLTHQNAAREVIDEGQASAIADALQAVDLAMQGGDVSSADIDALFPDLAGREPQLPPHLRALTTPDKPASQGDTS